MIDELLENSGVRYQLERACPAEQMLECYKPATDEEIERYIATADLDVSDWFNKNLTAANKAVMIANGREAADVYLRWDLEPGETPSHRTRDSGKRGGLAPTP